MRGFIPFPRIFVQKIYMAARLGFEQDNFDSTVQRFNHYPTMTSPQMY